MSFIVKRYLIFWGIIIVAITLSILFPALRCRRRAGGDKFPDNLPEEKPSLWWRIFKVIVIFILGYFVVCYNWFGLGGYFVCGKSYNRKCHQRYQEEITKRKQAESKSVQKNTASKVVKKNKR